MIRVILRVGRRILLESVWFEYLEENLASGRSECLAWMVELGEAEYFALALKFFGMCVRLRLIH